LREKKFRYENNFERRDWGDSQEGNAEILFLGNQRRMKEYIFISVTRHCFRGAEPVAGGNATRWRS